MGCYILYSRELYHYGIKGQKWGVRRFQNKDGSLTPAGKARLKNTIYGSDKSKVTTTSNRDHSKSDKSPLVKLALNVALDVMYLNPVGAAMDVGRLVQAGKSYTNAAKYNKDRENCKTDKTTGFLLKNKEMSQKEDASRVNPLVHNFDNNTKNNCMLCTAAYDLRRRGYEVRAKKASYGYVDSEVKAWYPKAKLVTVKGVNEKGKPSTKSMMSSLKNDLIKQGDGARGNLMITWKNMKGGHSVAYEIQNGNIRIIDAQIGKIYNNPDSFLTRCAADVSYARLDNIKFDTKTINEVAE
jgi:hypothetical protein